MLLQPLLATLTLAVVAAMATLDERDLSCTGEEGEPSPVQTITKLYHWLCVAVFTGRGLRASAIQLFFNFDLSFYHRIPTPPLLSLRVASVCVCVRVRLLLLIAAVDLSEGHLAEKNQQRHSQWLIAIG